jgi:osmotically-inducible protein OsmY
MNIGRKKPSAALCARIVPVVFGLAGFASHANAQAVASPVNTHSTISETSNPQGADPQSAKLQRRVAAALHAQPYFVDRHIDVSVHGRDVVLSGMVFSDWDLQDALRTARKVAGGRPVVDSLSIEEGGR